MSQSVLSLWNGGSALPDGSAIPAYPLPNNLSSAAPGADGLNIQGYNFAASHPSNQNTLLFRTDVNLSHDGSRRLFVRGNLQDDTESATPQFPGQLAGSVTRTNNKGIAAGFTTAFGRTFINSLRYVYVRHGVNVAGRNESSYVGFWNLSN